MCNRGSMTGLINKKDTLGNFQRESNGKVGLVTL